MEALHFMAASVHQDKGLFRQGARPNEAPAPTGLFNPALIDDDDDMEDEDDEDGGAGPSGITREQLSAALNSLSAFGKSARHKMQCWTQKATNQIRAVELNNCVFFQEEVVGDFLLVLVLQDLLLPDHLYLICSPNQEALELRLRLNLLEDQILQTLPGFCPRYKMQWGTPSRLQPQLILPLQF